jgi:hypothetical protein
MQRLKFWTCPVLAVAVALGSASSATPQATSYTPLTGKEYEQALDDVFRHAASEKETVLFLRLRSLPATGPESQITVRYVFDGTAQLVVQQLPVSVSQALDHALRNGAGREVLREASRSIAVKTRQYSVKGSSAKGWMRGFLEALRQQTLRWNRNVERQTATDTVGVVLDPSIYTILFRTDAESVSVQTEAESYRDDHRVSIEPLTEWVVRFKEEFENQVVKKGIQR